MKLEMRKLKTKSWIFIVSIALFGLLTLWATRAQPFIARYIVFRLCSRAFTFYEINHLKYPNSDFVMSEVTPTTKITMATHYTFYTTDNIMTVLEFMEQKLPGNVQMKGSYVKTEPTYRNSIGADETKFKSIFQVIGYHAPYIEVNIYPSTTGGTTIQISEHWLSMGVPSWLR
jgi:hypothetical protein